MTYELPPIVKASERLMREIEIAVTRFPRAHRYTLGSDLRSDVMRERRRQVETEEHPSQAWRDVIVDNAPARTRLLTLRKGGLIDIAAWERVGNCTGWHKGDGQTFLTRVTHWMPLPELPAQEAK